MPDRTRGSRGIRYPYHPGQLATHRTAEVNQWLKKRPHWHLHFTPTHSSWLNQVERFFVLITNQRIQRGSFKAVKELKAAIEQYIEHLFAYEGRRFPWRTPLLAPAYQWKMP
ncbi:transposase [Cerasicoccus maritimus]|uniref:transposase n=1 Tax=Cerasicoccus maritimus TaxID=490089 RepID=UPI0031B89074